METKISHVRIPDPLREKIGSYGQEIGAQTFTQALIAVCAAFFELKENGTI